MNVNVGIVYNINWPQRNGKVVYISWSPVQYKENTTRAWINLKPAQVQLESKCFPKGGGQKIKKNIFLNKQIYILKKIHFILLNKKRDHIANPTPQMPFTRGFGLIIVFSGNNIYTSITILLLKYSLWLHEFMYF